MTLKQLSICFIIGLGFFACTNQHGQHNKQLLQTAVQEVNTDSAFHLLNSVEANLLNDRDFAVYTILRVRLKEKMGQDISEDTLVFKARDYLLRVNDPYTDMALYVAANVHNHRGKPTQAINNYLETVNQTKDDILSGYANFNIARLHYLQGAYKQSLEFLNTTEKYYHVANAKYVDYMHSFELRGLNYLYLNKLDSALFYFKEAEKLAILYNDNQDIVYIVQNISLALCETKEYERAKEKCLMAISFSNPNDNDTQGRLQLILANILYNTDKTDSAAICAYNAEKLLINTDTPIDQINLAKLLSSIEEKRGNYKQALHYNQLHSNEKEAAHERKTDYQKANQDCSIQKIQQERAEYQKSKSDLHIVICFLGMSLLIALLVVAFFINKERFRAKFKELKDSFSLFQENMKVEKAKLEKELRGIQKERAREQELFQQEKVLAIEFQAQTNRDKIEAEKEKIVLQAELTEFKERAQKEKIALQAELTEFKEKAQKEKEECEKEINTSRRLCNEERIRLMHHIRDISKLREITEARNIEYKDVRRQINQIVEKLNFATVFPIIDHFYQGHLGALKIDFPQLNESENQTFILACAGFSSKEICIIILDMPSHHTANGQKTDIRKKLNLESRTDFQNFFFKRYGITKAFF